MFPPKSPFAILVKAALDESRRRGSKRLGTEHLLLGLLHDPASAAALGVGLDAARSALDQLDREALAALGLDVGALPAAGPPRKGVNLTPGRLTSGSKAVIDAAVRQTTRKTRADAPRWVLFHLLTCEAPDPCGTLLDHLGVDRAAVRARLAESSAPN
jgi:hypothetical protein